MTFDAFTLIAQLLNFAVLLLLLRVFLYGPIRRVMVEREARIAATEADAERARDTAREEAAKLRRERETLEGTRRERLEEVEREAGTLREERRAEVERAARAERGALADAFERERRRVLDMLRRRTTGVVVEAVRGGLADLAGASLEREAARAFRGRLEALDEEARDELRAAATAGAAVVTTAFEPSDDLRRELAEAVSTAIGASDPPRFATDARLLFGVALTVGGVRVGGSARDHLESLEAAFDEAVLDLRGASGAAERRERVP